ncbi:hypothetical protein ACOSP7_012083 [Xanthoceras sorbifolium]
MFDILFGWRKASKCKKLVRRVQCRLKFLKIKRNSNVMQLRDEIAQILKNGHHEIAFSRVEQLSKDQNLLAAYDLLEHFCECIIIHFSYIRKHKDCPNDINEAVSTLIFAAAWCGDLPELQMIRKLFGERYGHKFAKAAVELCPGTLVNSQIREKLCMKSIPENVKSRLMEEIAKDYNLPQGLHGCDNDKRLEPHLPKLCGDVGCQWEGFIFEEEAQVNCNSLGGAEKMLALCTNDKIIERSSNSNPARLIIEPLQVTAMHRSTMQVENCGYIPRTIPNRLAHHQSSLECCSSKTLSIVSLKNKAEPGSTAPASEISAYQFHKSTVNFQEVEEIQSSNTLQDQCKDEETFSFNYYIFPLADQSYGAQNCNRPGSWNVTACYGNSYRSCLSQTLKEKNVRCGKYYEETSNFSQDQKFICHQSGHHDKHPGRMPNDQIQYTRKTKKHICCSKMQRHVLSSQCRYNHRKSFCRCRFSGEMDSNCSLEHPCYHSVLEFHNDILVKKCRKLQVSDFSGSFAASCSRGPSPDIEPEPTIRSTNSSHSHVHPKLPDYSELAAKFKALKKEHQQRTAKEVRGSK